MGVNSLQWYHTPLLTPTSDEVILEGDEWHHCFNVNRMRARQKLIVCNGKGLCFEGEIRSTSSKEGRITLLKDLSAHFLISRLYKIYIGIAPTKNIDRTEFAIEKLVELGVDEICFLECHHGERTHLRRDRFQKIIISASKQSRKLNFPTLKALQSPTSFVADKRNVNGDIRILACHLDETSHSMSENYLAGEDVVIMIGPEGGFSTDEVKMMQEKKAKLVHLGPYRLRVETAAITACAHIHLLNEIKSR